MAKWKDILVGMREGASKGFDVGMLTGVPLIFAPKKWFPKQTFLQGLLRHDGLETRQGWNIGSMTGMIAICGTIGAVAGAVYGMFVPIAQRQKEESEHNKAEFERRQAMRDAGLNPDAPPLSPLQSPDMPQQKAYAVKMEPKESHSQGMSASTSHEETATRPKETALTR